jgi:TPR repeat protein
MSFFHQYLTDDQLFKLRYAQVVIRSDPNSGVRKVRELAEGGFIEAKYVYATLLREGKVVKQNMLLARKYYQEAAKANHAMALCRYGRLVKVEDQILAVQLFKRAADQGNAEGEYYYGRMLEISGVEEDALQYYSKACDKGLAKARFRYGRLHEVCPKGRRNYEICAKFYEIAAGQGSHKAQNNLGRLFELGLGVAQDVSKAVEYYQLASERGNTFARYNLARMLEKGLGIEMDQRRAADIYHELANDESNGLAQFHYARMCHNGIGVDIDYQEAKKFYLLAIDNNIAEAKQNYGVLLVTKFHEWNEAARYFEMAVSGEGAQASAKYDFAQLLLQGMGVGQDMDGAERLFAEAAESFIPAMFGYAQMLEAKFSEKATAYYIRAAAADDPTGFYITPKRNAQYHLALLYKEGKGVPVNPELSQKYMQMAADNHHPDAEAALGQPPEWSLSSLFYALFGNRPNGVLFDRESRSQLVLPTSNLSTP